MSTQAQNDISPWVYWGLIPAVTGLTFGAVGAGVGAYMAPEGKVLEDALYGGLNLGIKGALGSLAGLGAAYLISRIAPVEKMKWWQKLGLGLGIGAGAGLLAYSLYPNVRIYPGYAVLTALFKENVRPRDF